MGKETTEEVLESYFFEAALPADHKLLAAPPEVIKFRDELRLKWLWLCMNTKSEAPVVKLDCIFRTKPTGWRVETAIRAKPNTCR